MRIAWIFICLIGMNAVSIAAKIPVEEAQKLKALSTVQLAQDFRMVFHEVKNANICGGQGDAYIGQVQVNQYSRGYDAKGPKVSDNWVNIDRKYTIFKRELNEPNPRLFDPQHCME